MFLFRFCLVLIVVYAIFNRATRPWLNPYKLYMVFGKKGSGKSTLFTKLALRYMKKGWKVFSTEYIPGAYMIESLSEIGDFDFGENSVIFVGEAGIWFNNRKFKEFTDSQRKLFKWQRHYRLIIYLGSQSFDVDKSLRDLCDEMWLVAKKARLWSVARRINRHIVIAKGSAESPSTLQDDIHFAFPLSFSSWKITFLPAWQKYMDSFAAPKLRARPWKTWDKNTKVSTLVGSPSSGAPRPGPVSSSSAAPRSDRARSVRTFPLGSDPDIIKDD